MPRSSPLFVNVTCPECGHITTTYFKLEQLRPQGRLAPLCLNGDCDERGRIRIRCDDITKEGAMRFKVAGDEDTDADGLFYDFGSAMPQEEEPDE